MKSLSSEQRAAKFAENSQKNAPGLRSRGNRKLTLAEQQDLLEDLPNQSSVKRLESLRILREAVRSSSGLESTGLERIVYEYSAEEYIKQKEFGNAVHVLGHLCTLKGVSPYWRQVYVVALTNSKQFNDALKHCRESSDEKYVSSVLNMDIPLWKVLLTRQSDRTLQMMMEQLRPEIDNYQKRVDLSLKHPSQLKKPS